MGLGRLVRLDGLGIGGVGLPPAALGLLGVVASLASLESLGPEQVGINDRLDKIRLD